MLGSSLTIAQQALVKTAIEAWVNTMESTIASDLLSAYESDSALAQTYVAYSGSTKLDTEGSYVRIDGPRVWTCFDALGHDPAKDCNEDLLAPSLTRFAQDAVIGNRVIQAVTQKPKRY